MPGSGTSTFIDPDDYQASLDRVPLDLLLVMSRGEFRGLGDKRKAESPLSVAQRGGFSADRLRFAVSGACFCGISDALEPTDCLGRRGSAPRGDRAPQSRRAISSTNGRTLQLGLIGLAAAEFERAGLCSYADRQKSAPGAVALTRQRSCSSTTADE